MPISQISFLDGVADEWLPPGYQSFLNPTDESGPERWAHEKFPDAACVIAIEFKKFFMDEWTGQADEGLVDAIGDALQFSAPTVLETLRRG